MLEPTDYLFVGLMGDKGDFVIFFLLLEEICFFNKTILQYFDKLLQFEVFFCFPIFKSFFFVRTPCHCTAKLLNRFHTQF